MRGMTGRQKLMLAQFRRHERYRYELDWQPDEDLDDEAWSAFSHQFAAKLDAMRRPTRLDS